MELMSPLFTEAQRSVATHKKCVKALAAVRARSDEAIFRAELVKCANCALLVYKREPAVERLVQFLVAFVTAEDASAGGAEGTDEESLLTFFLDHLVKHHECKDKAVRFRATQMVGLIMNGLAEDAELSEDAFDAVQAAMLARTHDKVPLVRVHAAHALHRLQVPTEEDDPVTLELVRLMAADTSADVRLVALKSVGLSRHTLPHIIQRARDVKPEVRKATYAVVGAKLDPKWLSIAQRVALLRDGLRERDDAVRAACVEMVAVHWLRKAVGSASAVIATLDPEAHADVAELAARELVRVAGMPAELAAGAPWRNGAPRLRVEQALLLRVRFEMWAVGSASARAQLDECAPDVPALVGVLSAHAEQPAVLCELLRLARVLDLSDEAGRRMLGAHASALLGSTAHVARPGGAPLAVVALEVLRATHESELALVREVAELISELHDPLDGPDDDAGGEGGAARAPADAAPADAADAADAALADALARGGELKSQLASCVALDDLDAAAMIKRDIRELEEHVAQLEAARAPARRASDANVHALGALRLAHALLASTSCDARTPEIAGLLAAIILPAMQNAAEPVREVAAVCLGLSCSLGAQFASRYWPVLVQAAARDSAPVRAAALRALADVACTWSPAQLSAAAEGGAPGADGQEAAAECARALCRAAVRDGGAAEPEVQAAGAQGACKLLLLGRVDEPLRTPCLASALCALFAAEAAQRALDGDGARSDGANDGAADALGGMCQFVQLFLGAFRASEQRRALAAALVPLARASAAAPRRTAWANIDVERVARLVAFYAGEAACAPLALAIARELWARPDAAYSAALAKGLCALEPSAAPPGDGDEHSRADDALLAEACKLLRALVGTDSALDKAPARAVAKWLSAHARDAIENGCLHRDEDNGDDDGDDEYNWEAAPVPDAMALAAEEASRGHDKVLELILALCSSIPRHAAARESDGAPTPAPVGRATRRLAKKTTAVRAT